MLLAATAAITGQPEEHAVLPLGCGSIFAASSAD